MMELKPQSSTMKMPADWFVGDVYMNPVFEGEAPSQLSVAHVRFTPGARTNWHSHAGGQLLRGTDGVGVVVNRNGTVIRLRSGDVVWTPPGEEHWHGACRDNFMSHLAMWEIDDEGNSVTWLEPVTDEEHEAASVKASADD